MLVYFLLVFLPAALWRGGGTKPECSRACTHERAAAVGVCGGPVCGGVIAACVGVSVCGVCTWVEVDSEAARTRRRGIRGCFSVPHPSKENHQHRREGAAAGAC